MLLIDFIHPNQWFNKLNWSNVFSALIPVCNLIILNMILWTHVIGCWVWWSLILIQVKFNFLLLTGMVIVELETGLDQFQDTFWVIYVCLKLNCEFILLLCLFDLAQYVYIVDLENGLHNLRHLSKFETEIGSVHIDTESCVGVWWWTNSEGRDHGHFTNPYK